MRRFWASLAVQLGKRAGLVSVVGLLVTLILGFGITKLEFATGQDAYLNGSDQVYKDNVKYQNLFGGQAMVVLFSMDKGKRVEDLFTPKNIAQMQAATAEIAQEQRGAGGHQPRHRAAVHRQPGPALLRQPHERHTRGRPHGHDRRPDPAEDRQSRGPGKPRAKVRQADFNKTASRLLTREGAEELLQPRVGEVPHLRQRRLDP